MEISFISQYQLEDEKMISVFFLFLTFYAYNNHYLHQINVDFVGENFQNNSYDKTETQTGLFMKKFVGGNLCLVIGFESGQKSRICGQNKSFSCAKTKVTH